MAPKCGRSVLPVAKVAVNAVNAVAKAVVNGANVVANADQLIRLPKKTTPLNQR